MTIKKIAVLTSGGDAPGMNAAIRSVVRTAIRNKIEVFSVNDGYIGLYDDSIWPIFDLTVSDLINVGGTYLGTSRFPEFKEASVRKKAILNLSKYGIDALVVIGGDGSYMGAMKLTEEGLPCIGIPATIDNDVAGTDYAIGFSTALNTIVEAIDRLRDTSASHQRISLIEVMGKNCADLAIHAAIAAGCDSFLCYDEQSDIHIFLNQLKNGLFNSKMHACVVVSEKLCNVHELAKQIEKTVHQETRATVLGHIQRGGSPVPYDRILASQMGEYAVKLLMNGYGGRCVGVLNGKMVHHDIIDAIKHMKHPFNWELYNTANNLA